ncbi:MAG: tetratricopeptide repeat protein [Bacteroidota bacterium]|nr:tetratricopeptide repeat protein [Bacteroidota bacterium]MDP3144215.1 tetratricopeptide repeat protein [Bacteroidota bacterium]
MINKFLFLLTVLLSVKCLSQNKTIDSLQTVLKTELSDTNKIKTLNALGSKLYEKAEYDLALQYVDEAKQLAKEINYKKGSATSYKLTGYILIKKGEYTNALDAIDKSIIIQKALGDKLEIGAGYNFKGNIYLMKGDFQEALTYLLQGLKILEETKSRKAIGMAYNGIGIAYYSQHNYDKATEAFKKSLRFKDSIKDKLGIAVGYNNLGIIYLDQKNYVEAIDSYTASLKLRQEIGDKQGIADCYDNIGIVYYEQEKYDEAIKYHFKALEIAKELKYLYVISHSYINIGKVYLKLGKLNAAGEYLNLAADLGKKLEDKAFIKDVYQQLSELNYLKGDFKKAYEYHKVYSLYIDKLYDIQSNKQMAEMSEKYESEKKDKELLKLAKDNEVKQIELERKEIEKRNLLIIVVGVIVVLLILVLLGVILKRSNTKMKNINTLLVKQSEEIEQKNREINTQAVQIARYQSQMNPHFIFNAINGLQSMVLEEDKFKAIEQIQSLSKLLRLTLNNSESEYITISEEENYLNKYIEFELLRFKKKFKFKFDANEDVEKNLFIPTMIIQPMVENAIKHAGLNDIDNGEIAVRLSMVENAKGNLLEIEIIDNGKGLKKGADGHESKGLKITKQRLLLELKKNDIYIEEYLSIKDRIYDENNIINGTRVKIICPCYMA